MKTLLYTVILSNFLWLSTGKAEVNYRVYSDDYTNCLKENSYPQQSDKCAKEEYFRIRENLIQIQKDLYQVPQFQSYNNGQDSLLKNIKNMEQYGMIYCEYMQAASEKQSSLPECMMQQINFLYVDLYKLYQEVNKKAQ